MKSDVLSGFDTIRVCTGYMHNGIKIDHLPYNIEDGEVEPIYEDLPGWKEDITEIENYEDIPQSLKNYVSYLQEKLAVPISIISVGPNRNQTISIEKISASV